MDSTRMGRRERAAKARPVRQVFYSDGEQTSTPMIRAVVQRLGAETVHFGSTRACLAELRIRRCHLLISNSRRPATEAVDLLAGASELRPPVPVLVLVDHGDIQAAVEVMKGGAVDCLERPPQQAHLAEVIGAALRESARNWAPLQRPLTPAEKQVLNLVLQGRTTNEIARLLHRSARTIEVHRSHTMHKLGASTLIDLVRTAAQLGLLET